MSERLAELWSVLWAAVTSPKPLSWPVGDAALALNWPLLLLVLPLPWLLARRWQAYETRREALHTPFFAPLVQATQTPTHRGAVVLEHTRIEAVVLSLAWLALVLAATQPVWIEPPLTKIVPRRDLLLALDISQSMETPDVPAGSAGGKTIARIEAAKQAIDDFISRRDGDRLGLVVFGDGAYLSVPFTEDHALVRQMLTETRTGLAGPRTKLGEAIGLGIKLFDASKAPSRVMVLLTDGADTGSRIPPETAARGAGGRKVVVHTVALGQPRNAVDKVDTATLQTIARITHGRFALAGRADELQSVYAQLDALETRNHDTLIHRPQRPLHQWPLGAAVLLPLVWQLVRALVALVQSLRRSLARSSNRSSVPGEVPHA